MHPGKFLSRLSMTRTVSACLVFSFRGLQKAVAVFIRSYFASRGAGVYMTTVAGRATEMAGAFHCATVVCRWRRFGGKSLPVSAGYQFTQWLPQRVTLFKSPFGNCLQFTVQIVWLLMTSWGGEKQWISSGSGSVRGHREAEDSLLQVSSRYKNYLFSSFCHFYPSGHLVLGYAGQVSGFQLFQNEVAMGQFTDGEWVPKGEFGFLFSHSGFCLISECSPPQTIFGNFCTTVVIFVIGSWKTWSVWHNRVRKATLLFFL